MSTEFDIQVENEPTYAGVANAKPAAAAAPPAVDINSLELADEELHIEDGASAFDFPPPPSEAGNPYLAKLMRGQRGQMITLAGVNAEKAIALAEARNHPGAKVKHMTDHIEIRLQSDKAGASAKRTTDGKDPVGFDNASTAPYGGSCRAAGILKEGLKKALPSPPTHRSIANALWEALASEPQCKVAIQWKAFCKPCEQEIRGERAFPQNADGSHRPVVQCPKCKSELNANWQPARYLPA